ncbi:MAG: trimethylamine methyltransferase family protein [Candidatus Aerophobetes bacterium]|nr:trimethylamine methyltransferase family protein [Candidatus Aerophobetes bacterium]
MLKGFTRKFKPLEILTEEQLEEIHRGTLEILENTGIVFHHEKALKLFNKNGCKVDFEKRRVYFPPGLVEESLHKCPSSFHMKARDPKNDLRIGGNTFYFTSACGMKTIDLDTWEPRVATKQENYDGVTILDALDNCHFLTVYCPYFGFEGVPSVMAIPESIAAKIRNSTKVQAEGYSQDCEIFNIKMAKAVGIEIMGAFFASPPLTYYEEAVEAAFRYVKARFPIYISSGCVYGATGPATIAGSTMTTSAEITAGIVLTQLIKTGTRVVANNYTFPQNMKTGSPAFGQIGLSLHNVAFNQIWREYEVPVWNANYCPSSSKKIDFQCGYETAIGALIAALSGSSLVGLHGEIYGELSYHPIQSILDEDIAGMIGRFVEGVEVNDETLAVDLIGEVGPIPGFYLNKEHTRKWWKKEQFVPKAADRLTYPEWMEKGKKSCLDYAKERMDEILSTHKPIPLAEDQDKEIERILKEARKYYKEKGMM